MIGVSPRDLEEEERGFRGLTEAIERAETIAIGSHTSPDGDALGSELALAEIIRRRWPGKEVVSYLADAKPVPRHLRFLPHVDELREPDGVVSAPDLFIAVDLSVASRLASARSIMEAAREVFVLDHHPTEHPFGDHGFTRPEAAACGVMVLEYARWLGVPVEHDVANLLFCAVMTDTGRFQYQNADSEAFWAAGELVAAGADPSLISLHVYQSMSLTYIKLESLVMGRITTREEGRIALSWVLWEDFLATGAAEDEAEGLVDIVRCVDGAEVALLLRQTPEGEIRGNLRSKGELDVSKVACALGGGGHAAAAGFTLDARTIDEAGKRVLPLLEELVDAG